jgi:hypothetical protein
MNFRALILTLLVTTIIGLTALVILHQRIQHDLDQLHQFQRLSAPQDNPAPVSNSIS